MHVSYVRSAYLRATMLLLYLHQPSEGDYSRILIFFERFLKFFFLEVCIELRRLSVTKKGGICTGANNMESLIFPNFLILWRLCGNQETTVGIMKVFGKGGFDAGMARTPRSARAWQLDSTLAWSHPGLSAANRTKISHSWYSGVRTWQANQDVSYR